VCQPGEQEFVWNGNGNCNGPGAACISCLLACNCSVVVLAALSPCACLPPPQEAKPGPEAARTNGLSSSRPAAAQLVGYLSSPGTVPPLTVSTRFENIEHLHREWPVRVIFTVAKDQVYVVFDCRNFHEV
jgi:hypothetical protein